MESVCRLLRNRVSAQQARERKKQYVSELELKLQTKDDQITRLSAELRRASTTNATLRRLIQTMRTGSATPAQPSVTRGGVTSSENAQSASGSGMATSDGAAAAVVPVEPPAHPASPAWEGVHRGGGPPSGYGAPANGQGPSSAWDVQGGGGPVPSFGAGANGQSIGPARGDLGMAMRGQGVTGMQTDVRASASGAGRSRSQSDFGVAASGTNGHQPNGEFGMPDRIRERALLSSRTSPLGVTRHNASDDGAGPRLIPVSAMSTGMHSSNLLGSGMLGGGMRGSGQLSLRPSVDTAMQLPMPSFPDGPATNIFDLNWPGPPQQLGQDPFSD